MFSHPIPETMSFACWTTEGKTAGEVFFFFTFKINQFTSVSMKGSRQKLSIDRVIHRDIKTNNLPLFCFTSILNPLSPSDAIRNKKKIEDLFSSVLSQFKTYHPSGNLKFNYLGISQSLKLRTLMKIFLSISLTLNFTPFTLGFYGLKQV